MTRMNPTKKAYYTIVLEEMKLEDQMNNEGDEEQIDSSKKNGGSGEYNDN